MPRASGGGSCAVRSIPLPKKKKKPDILFRDRKLIVMKFGGTSLAEGDRLHDISHRLAAMARTMDIIAVVSAMGDSTSHLIKLAYEATEGNPSAQDTIELAAHGEMIAARAMKAALTHVGMEARAITPFGGMWPIIAIDESPQLLSLEKINEDKPIKICEEPTRKLLHKHILPLVKQRIIPVICGFLALDPDGSLITLGRGGSDTTAFLVAKLLEADEVIIVTDVEGVFDADPKRVSDPGKVKYISLEEMDSLALSGVAVIHPKALAYKSPHTKARVTHYDEETYELGGTEISGFLKATLDFCPHPLALISVVLEGGEERSRIAEGILEVLKESGAEIHGMASTNNYIGVYLREDQGESAYHQIHKKLTGESRFKAIALKKDIARVLISSPKFQPQPGVVAMIGAALAKEEINISDIITLQNDINIYINWDERKQVGLLLRRLALDAALEEFAREPAK
jgi:aspartate kinase